MHFHEQSEMERVLDLHLRSCPSCRRKVMGLQSLLRGDAACANFG
jgi:hypothetical protein